MARSVVPVVGARNAVCLPPQPRRGLICKHRADAIERGGHSHRFLGAEAHIQERIERRAGAKELRELARDDGVVAPERRAVSEPRLEQRRVGDERVDHQQPAARVPRQHARAGRSILPIEVRDQFRLQKGDEPIAGAHRAVRLVEILHHERRRVIALPAEAADIGQAHDDDFRHQADARHQRGAGCRVIVL